MLYFYYKNDYISQASLIIDYSPHDCFIYGWITIITNCNFRFK